MLGNSEDHTALSRALSQLAEVEEKIDQLHQDQAYADFYLFSELLGDYVRLITAVKVFTGDLCHCWNKALGNRYILLFFYPILIFSGLGCAYHLLFLDTFIICNTFPMFFSC